MNQKSKLPHLKKINLDLENKLNKKSMNNEPITSKQDQQNHITWAENKNQHLRVISKKYGKVIDQEIRKDSKQKRGNITIVTFSTKNSPEKAITNK